MTQHRGANLPERFIILHISYDREIILTVHIYEICRVHSKLQNETNLYVLIILTTRDTQFV